MTRPDAPRQPVARWIVVGVLIAAASFAKPLVGGEFEVIGLRRLAIILIGAALVATQVWSSAGRVRPGQCVMVWLWMGLLCGVVEVLIKFGFGLVWPRVLHEPDTIVWMIPAAYVSLYLLAGLLCAVGVRVAPRHLTLPVVAFMPASILAWTIMGLFGWLHAYVAAFVALAVGIVVARVAAAHHAGFLRFSRATALAMALGVAVAGAAVAITAAERENSALAALPAPAEDATNVLLIVLDTVRADHLGVHGYERDTTPAIDQLASQGVVFDWAISPSPWTLPAHAAMFTGRYPHEVSANWRRALDGTHRTLAEVLSAHGYATAGFVGNLSYCGAENGLARGFSRYEDFLLKPSTMFSCASLGNTFVQRVYETSPAFVSLRNDAREITDGFLGWLEGRPPDGRPFFAFLNFFDAHAMYLAPEGYDTKFGARGSRLTELHKYAWWSDWTAAEQDAFVVAYDGCIAFIDSQLERLLGALRTRGLLEDTLVIVTGDHGEQFGEHDLREHANSLYLPLVHVPLVLRLPDRVPAQTRVEEFVSLVDLPATVLDLVGVRPAEPMPGHSLTHLWGRRGEAVARSAVLAEVSKSIGKNTTVPAAKGAMTSVFVDGLQLIENGDGVEELYDVRVDPAAENDLLGARPAAAGRLRALMRALR